jgi:hypothetical protein
MFALIKREIWDHAVYFLASALVSALFIVLVVFGERIYWREISPGLAIPIFIVLFIIFCMIGSSQMYSDRAGKISTMLSTLAVTRSHIFLARIITGILAIFLSMLLMLVAMLMVLYYFSLPIHIFQRSIIEVFITLFLTGLGCYSIGLQVGWTANKLMFLVGFAILAPLLITFVVIKGFDLQAISILILFDCLCLVRSYYRFLTTPL